MGTLPKINVGRKVKRSYFDLQHDGETTANFGFCQPTISRLVNPNTKISLDTKTFVRLAPLPCPTFGRIEVKQHTTFTPITDVFLGFNYFQAGKSVNSAVRQYIPTQVDNLQGKYLFASLLSMFFCSKTYVNGDDYSGLSNSDMVNLKKLPFRMSIHAPRYAVASPTWVSDHPQEANEVIDLLNDESWHPAWKTGNEFAEIVNQQVNGLSLVNRIFNADKLSNAPFHRWMQANLNTSYRYFQDTVTGVEPFYNGNSQVTMEFIQSMLSFDSERFYFNSANSENIGNWNHSYNEQISGLVNSAFPFMTNYNHFYDTWKSYEWYRNQFTPMSFENADFQMVIPSSLLNLVSFDYDTYYMNDGVLAKDGTFGYTGQFDVAINFHLTEYGKKLIGKVLNPLKIYFSSKNKVYSILPLLALYKSYFDKYNPGRNVQWLETNAFKLIHSFYDTGVPIGDFIENQNSSYTSIAQANSIRAAWYGFLYDLGEMYYSLPIDNITVAQDEPVLSNTYDPSTETVTLYADTDHNSVMSVTSDTPYGSIDDVAPLGGLGVKALSRLLTLTNKRNNFGARVNDYLRAKGYTQLIPDTDVLGDNSFMCNISDVIGTVNNDSTLLGEYAGKGIGFSDGEHMHYETKTFGFLTQFMCVVPLGGYCQAVSHQHINKYDFYQPEYDSLGMDVLSYDEVLGRNYYLNKFADNEKSFGFVPRYWQDKVITNTSAGDFSLRGSQAQFLPYTLNRLFFVSDLRYKPGTGNPVYRDQPVLFPDEELRYIGKIESNGNYDRIFYDTTGLTDNFIVHMVHNLKIWSPMKPISDSFDSYDPEVDDDVMQVNKA